MIVGSLNERRKMTRRKVLLTTVLSTGILGLAFAGTTFAASQTQTRTQTNKPAMTAEEAAKMDTEMATRMTNAFDVAEKAGKITAEQKATLLTKDAAIRAKMKSGDREGAEALIKEMHDWMVANKIDASVMPKPAGPRGSNPDGPHHNGNSPTTTK